jgi:Bacterial toxin 28
VLRPDLDSLDALSGDRDAQWTRLQATTFLTDDEKRALVGYGPKPQEMAHKYSPDQPRDDHGRWEDGGGDTIVTEGGMIPTAGNKPPGGTKSITPAKPAPPQAPTPPTPKPPGGKPSQKDIDAYRGVLEPRHLDTFRRELNGEVVATKKDGTPFDHVTEVREAMRGLENTMNAINKELGSPTSKLTTTDRQTLTERYAAGSRQQVTGLRKRMGPMTNLVKLINDLAGITQNIANSQNLTREQLKALRDGAKFSDLAVAEQAILIMKINPWATNIEIGDRNWLEILYDSTSSNRVRANVLALLCRYLSTGRQQTDRLLNCLRQFEENDFDLVLSACSSAGQALKQHPVPELLHALVIIMKSDVNGLRHSARDAVLVAGGMTSREIVLAERQDEAQLWVTAATVATQLLNP